jgi:hypothetical protein
MHALNLVESPTLKVLNTLATVDPVVLILIIVLVLAALLLLARMAFRSSDTDTHFSGFGLRLDITRQRRERQQSPDDEPPSRNDEPR